MGTKIRIAQTYNCLKIIIFHIFTFFLICVFLESGIRQDIAKQTEIGNQCSWEFRLKFEIKIKLTAGIMRK